MFPVSIQARRLQAALHFLCLLGYLLVPLSWRAAQAAPYLQQPEAQTTEAGEVSSLPPASALPAVQEERPFDTAPLAVSQQSQRHPEDTGTDILPSPLDRTDPEQNLPTIPSPTDNITLEPQDSLTNGLLVFPSIPQRLGLEGTSLDYMQEHKTFSVLPSAPIDASDKVRKYAVDEQRRTDREVRINAADPDGEDDWSLLFTAIIIAVSLRVVLWLPGRWQRRPPAQLEPAAAVGHDAQQGRATTQGHRHASHLYRPTRIPGTVHKTTASPPLPVPVWADPQLWQAMVASEYQDFSCTPERVQPPPWSPVSPYQYGLSLSYGRASPAPGRSLALSQRGLIPSCGN